MRVLPAADHVSEYLRKHNLTKKYEKQIKLLEENPRHPSLGLERLEPKERGIYSFRLDRRFRALLIFRDDLQSLEVIAITKHYR